MEWQIIVALVVAIPIILFPVVFVWYLNIGGFITAFKEARQNRAVNRKATRHPERVIKDQEYEMALTKAIKRFPWQRQ